MRKPDFAVCEQQRHRSACASAQTDQHLCFSLSGNYNSSTCNMQKFKILVSLCSWAGCFEPYLVANPEDRFSPEDACNSDLIYQFILENILRKHWNSVLGMNWVSMVKVICSSGAKIKWSYRGLWLSVCLSIHLCIKHLASLLFLLNRFGVYIWAYKKNYWTFNQTVNIFLLRFNPLPVKSVVVFICLHHYDIINHISYNKVTWSPKSKCNIFRSEQHQWNFIGIQQFLFFT